MLLFGDLFSTADANQFFKISHFLHDYFILVCGRKLNVSTQEVNINLTP